MVQWLGIQLLMEGTWVQSLVSKDPTRHGANKPTCHNSWASTLEPASCNYWAHVPQLLKPMIHHKRSHHNEQPAQCSWIAPSRGSEGKPVCSNKDPAQPKTKINKEVNVKTKLKTEVPYDSAIPLQGIYLRKMKTLVQKDICSLCSLRHYLQYSRHGINLSIHHYMNG